MTIRNFAKSVVAMIVVSLSSYLLEVRLHHDGVPGRDLIIVSNLMVGFVAGALVYVLSVRERQRQAYVECRLRVIADMNHHIRNALQVITLHSRSGEKQEVGIVGAVERIQWALREVLPQMPGSLAAAEELSERGTPVGWWQRKFIFLLRACGILQRLGGTETGCAARNQDDDQSREKVS